MFTKYIRVEFALILFLYLLSISGTYAEIIKPKFQVLAFYTAKNDKAHISYVAESLKWFPKIAKENKFGFTATNDWNNMNSYFLSSYQLVIFLDTRPELPTQRDAFRKFMESGGEWMGFHFSAFALSPSAYPQNWDWYHEEFLGSGQYKSNTWRPTAAILHIEDAKHSIAKGLSLKFVSAPNEWYRWENDLKANHDIKILLSIDPASFPLGTSPKSDEIWYEGDYPVVWTNTRYKMVYINMGHNDIDYEHKLTGAIALYHFPFKIKCRIN